MCDTIHTSAFFKNDVLLMEPHWENSWIWEMLSHCRRVGVVETGKVKCGEDVGRVKEGTDWRGGEWM